MQSHGALEILMRHMLKRTDFDNAGVVDQDVDLAKAIDDLPNSRLNLPGIQQVALHGQRRTAARSKIGLCARELIRVARNKCNVAVSRANLSRKHEPKSARPACDEHDLVVQGIARGSNEAQN